MAPETQLGAVVGAVLGGAYQITRLLGEGGMGWVYEARQLRLNKRVAVKLMARELAANPEAMARFHREAEVTSHLGHPHLVNVIDFGATDNGEPYLVMEYLDGEDLDHRLRRVGRLPLATAVEITKQVASALGAAHDEGIVHRDLKPGNVFLVKVKGEEDFVKVLDFGVSKIKAARTKLTRATAVIGTPEYMSPEQATGLIEDIDHRTDQWALGCIAWEMLSGHAPFIADDMGALFYQVINMDPHPLARRAPGLPPAVEPVLRRALAKRAADRFPSIKDFARAFETAATGRQRELTPPPIEVPRPPVAKETMGYGPAVEAAKPAGIEVKEAARTQPDAVPEEVLPTRQYSADDLARGLAKMRGKPISWIVAAAVLLLIGELIVLWSSYRRPVASQPAAVAPSPRLPEVVTLPSPAPAPEPVAAPAPPPVAPARVPRAKAAKPPVLDDLMKNPAAEKPPSGMKPSPFADPFEPERARPRPSLPSEGKKPAKPRPQGELIEEL